MVTAGPTNEYIDPVRFITNRSSGKQGYAIAESLSRKSSQSLRETKRIMRAAMTSTYEETFKLEAEANNSLHSSEDSLEAVQAFFEKREPNFK